MCVKMYFLQSFHIGKESLNQFENKCYWTIWVRGENIHTTNEGRGLKNPIMTSCTCREHLQREQVLLQAYFTSKRVSEGNWHDWSSITLPCWNAGQWLMSFGMKTKMTNNFLIMRRIYISSSILTQWDRPDGGLHEQRWSFWGNPRGK